MNQQLQNQNERRGATSASNAQADALCRGRHLAQRGIPEPPEDADSRHGRLIHEALKNNNPQGLTIEQRDIFDACQSIELKILTALFPEAGVSKQQMKVWREERFWVQVPHGQVKYEHSAKPDVVFRFGTRALIVEYKTLQGDVPESPTNLQLRDQAVLVRGNLLVNEIAVVVIQPLVTHSPNPCYYTAEDLKRSEDDMFERVIASNDPQSPRTPGDVQCKFCLAKKFGKCREYHSWAGGMVPNMLTLLDVPASEWTPDQKAFFLDRASVAQKWLDDCTDQIKESLIADPNSVPGWRMKEGAIREKITNPQGVFDRFASLGGKVENFMACVSITKKDLREQVHAVTGAKGAALDKAMKTITEGMIEAKQNAPSLERVVEK